MPESRITQSVSRLISGFFGKDVVEERLAQYLVREIRGGRRFDDILNDPYITNRLDEEHRQHLLNNPDVIKAVEEEVAKAFESEDFGFKP